MTRKAQRIMNRVKENDRRRILAQLNDPRHRNRLMGGINLLDQDETSRVGSKDEEIKVLSEMNELQQFEHDNWSRNS